MNNLSNKKRIVWVALYPQFSAYNAMFPVAKELDRQDYRVVFVGNSTFSQYVNEAGFEYRIIEPEKEWLDKLHDHHDRELDAMEIKSRFSEFRVKARLNLRKNLEVGDHLQEKVSALIQEIPPNLVLSDCLVPQNAIPFLKANIPIVGVSTCLSSVFSWRTPPVFSKVIPYHKLTAFNRIRNLVAWLKLALRRLKERVMFKAYFVVALGVKGLREGKPIQNAGGKVRLGEYGDRLDVPELVMAPRELDFPQVVKSMARHYAGACVDASRPNDPFDWSRVDPDKRLIYCSLGSHSEWAKDNWLRLIASLTEAMAHFSDTQLIVQVSDEKDREAIEPVPSNVIVADWVPQLEVLEKADLFITHGGLSSVREAIYFSVPMIVFPYGMDQPGNAARIVYHQLGLRGDISSVNAGNVTDLIEKTMTDAGIQNSMKRMRDIFHQQTSYGDTVSFLEKYMKTNLE
jgi:UDP:flavonoid glycosyltransferase YjiC (YdhE family)